MGLKDQDLAYRVQDSWLRVRVQGLRCRVSGSGLEISHLGFGDTSSLRGRGEGTKAPFCERIAAPSKEC